MSQHKASISWKHTGPDFLKGKYSREHTWTFDGGATVPASPSPSVVPSGIYMGDLNGNVYAIAPAPVAH